MNERTSRTLVVFFGTVVLVSLFFLTRSWNAPILDRYEFRQLQTALSTYWIMAEGWRLDYPLPLFGPPWSVPMEFPLYQTVVAVLAGFTGMPLEQAGRLVSLVSLFATLAAGYDLLAVTGLRPSRRLIVLATVLVSPVYLFYGRAFMIETTALCLSISFLALLRRALANPHWSWIAATTAMAGLAALVKITTFIIFGLPAAAMVLAHLRGSIPADASPSPRTRRWVAAAAPAILALAASLWWVRFGDTVKNSNPFTGFLTSGELRAWNFGTWELRLDSSFWIHLHDTVSRFVLAEGALVLAAVCAFYASARVRFIAAIAFASFMSGPLVFANLYHVHDYYYAANALMLTGACGLLVASAWDDRRLPRGANWLVLILVAGCQIHAYYRGYHSHHLRPPPPPPAFAEVIRESVPVDGVVLIYGADWNPLLAYYSQRRVLMVPGERENETEVLEVILGRLPPLKIAAMVTHGEKFRGRQEFILERTQRFALSAQPLARSGETDLYLPEGRFSEVASRLQSRTFSSVEILAAPAEDAFSAALSLSDSTGLDLAMLSPLPFAIRSGYGVSNGEIDGQPILNTHAPAELHFAPQSGARTIRATVGLMDGAYEPGRDAVTDGISVEIFEVDRRGFKRSLLKRDLNPVTNPTDRGPQTLHLEREGDFAGNLIFRLTTGKQGNPTNDWAYWSRIEIR